MTSTTLGHPHSAFHPHFAHHVRTKAWGIEPGWKFVNHPQVEQKHFPSDILIDPARRSFRSTKESSPIPTSSSFAGDHRIHFPDSGIIGIGRSYVAPSSPFAAARGTSFRDHHNHHRASPTTLVSRNIEIKLVDHHPGLQLLQQHQPQLLQRQRSKSDEDYPVHYFSSTRNNNNSSSAPVSAATTTAPSSSSHTPQMRSTLPRVQKPQQFPVDHRPPAPAPPPPPPPPLPTRVSPPPRISPLPMSSTMTGSYIEAVQPPPPQGVLKKPGVYRGPKSMKKVAFLENAEFSRGIP